MTPFRIARPVFHPLTRDGVNTYTVYTGNFNLPALKEGAFLSVCASSDYSFEIDGELLAFGQFSDYEENRVYDRIALPPLAAGAHSVRCTVFSVGCDTSTARRRPSEVIFEIASEDGVLLASGADTRCYPHPCFRQGSMEMVSGQLGFTFAYDARRENEAVAPISASVITEERTYSPRPIEKLRVGEPLAPQGVYHSFCAMPRSEGTLGQRYLSAKEDENGEGELYRFDFGKETTGILTLSLDSPEEQELLIAWGEHITDGDVRAEIGWRNFTCSYYAKKGRNDFTMPFLRFGLRYLSVKLPTRGTDLHYVTVRETLYPIPQAQTLRCGDEIHNRISDVCLRTLLLCMHNHYEDCPWREQALYTMDSRNQMLCGYVSFGETRFARASLSLIAASLREDGLLELCSPAHVSITIPSFSAIFLTQVGEYTDYSGDLSLFREIRHVLLRIADGFLSHIDPAAGLIPCYTEERYWNFYEWQDGLAGSISGSVAEDDVTFDSPLNAMVSFGLSHLARLLRAVGDGEEASRYEAARLALNTALSRFYDPEKGAYAACIVRKTGEKRCFAELASALVLYAGAADPETEQTVLSHLTDKSLIPVTLSHSIFKYDVLMRRPETYGAWVFSDIRRIWGGMLEKGATTFWETEEGESAFGNAGSLCHGWSAIPLYFYRVYAGRPDECAGLSDVGFKEIDVEHL